MREYEQFSLEELRDMARAVPSVIDLPQALCEELHYRLWNWIVNNADDFPAKSQWPGWDAGAERFFGGHCILFACFLCAQHFEIARPCVCPLNKAAAEGCDTFHRWARFKEQKYLPGYKATAEQIRDCVLEADHA